MKINVASQTIGAEMITASDGSAFTGAVTVYVTGDGGTQALGSVGSGACTHEGNGFHTYVPAQAETNYAHVAFTFIGTGAIPATVQLYTNFPQTVDNATNISAIKTKTDFLPSITAGSSGGVFIAGTNAATTITTGLTTTFTGNLTGSVASVTARVTANTDQLGGQTVTAAGAVTVNAELGASATAMNAFEDQYDGTGLSGDTYPATQAQLSGLSVASAAQSVSVKPSPNGFVLTTGSEVNTEDSTVALDGIRHELTDAAGTLDGYYKFDIEAGAVPVSLTLKAVVNGGNDTFGVYANIGSSSVPSWSQRASITGTGTTANSIYEIDLYSSDVVTDLTNEVWIRIYGTGLTTSSFDIDQAFVSRSFNYQYSGYDNGAVWIDTVDGTAGTTPGYHGIASRTVDTLADALTIAASVGLDIFHISNDSTITLASSTTNQEYFGVGWSLALGGQDVSNSHFSGANSVTGTSTSATGETHFDHCEFGTATIGNGHLKHCGFSGTITLAAASDYFFIDCYSQVPGATTPIIDMGAAVGASNLSLRHYSGGITINNLAAGDVLTLEGTFGTVTLNGADAQVEIRGIAKAVTNNLTGSPTVNDNTIKSSVIDELTTQGDTNETKLDTLTTNVATVDTVVDAILVDTGTTLPALIDDLAIKKNTAFSNFEFLMVLTSDHATPATGLTVTGQRSIDGAAFASVSGTIAEVSNGIYQFDALAADTNGDVITWRFSSATADDTFLTFKTVQ